jgi:hypothetical protein
MLAIPLPSGVRNVSAWNDEDVALACWIDRLDDKDFFILRAMIDFRDCLIFVSNYVAKLAVFVKEPENLE